jgi:hypothetical protein
VTDNLTAYQSDISTADVLGLDTIGKIQTMVNNVNLTTAKTNES